MSPGARGARRSTRACVRASAHRAVRADWAPPPQVVEAAVHRRTMPTGDGKRADPTEQAIETALQPGRFISYGAARLFVEGLEKVAAKIAALVRPSPSPAVTLYETFIAGCYEKAEELDDSSGSFGSFVESLFCGWAKARRAAGANPDDTACRLLAWMDDDPYGFCYRLERELVKVFNKPGLVALERHVRDHFDRKEEASQEGQRTRDPTFARRRWGEALRTILVARRDVEAYVKLCEETELTPEDTLAIARMLQARGKPADALAWVERGLTLATRTRASLADHELGRLKRELLRKLGRGDAALEAAWAEFQDHPNKYTHEELMRYVPEADRAAWHAKAMDAAAEADLHSQIELWLETGERDRLVERLRMANDEELEGTSHYATEPAAKTLAETHPDVAGKVYRALGMRLIKEKKSKYYGAALSHLKETRRCYERAGLRTEWEELVRAVRADHRRKVGFMAGFEELVAGAGPSTKPSFLERAKVRWARSPGG